MLNRVTRLLQPEAVPPGFESLSPGVFHASTIVFPNLDAFLGRQERLDHGYSYGQNGTPTYYELALKIAALEGGGSAVLVPTGLAAIVAVNAAFLRAGESVLVPEGAYGPSLDTLRALFGRWGIETVLYPTGAGARIAEHMTPKTRLIWTESPCSNTMEMQDVPAIARVAHEHGALVAMDNTWATPLGFRPLEYGVDFAMQALTKYVGGHSDLLMGAVTTTNEAHYHTLRETVERLGYAVSPSDCFMALRGIGTMALRLERHFASALKVAAVVREHPAVAAVNYPPLPGAAGHDLWSRDYTLGSGALSFRLREPGLEPLRHFCAVLRLFRLGASWGGLHSLVAVVPEHGVAELGERGDAQWLVRLHVGLEDPADLVADLRAALNSACNQGRDSARRAVE